MCHYYTIIAKPPFTNPPFVNSRPRRDGIQVRKRAEPKVPSAPTQRRVHERPGQVNWVSHTKVAQSHHNTGLSVRITTFYGFPIVAEQEHVRRLGMSPVKHPMLRLSQNITT